MSNKYDVAALALGRIEGFSDDERGAVVAFLKIGRARASGFEGGPPAVTVLADRAFSWPEFDRWQAFFAARGAFPARWDGLQAAPAPQTPPAARVDYQRRKLDLLFEWLDTLAQGAVALGHYTRRGIRTRIVRQEDGQLCGVCESFNGHEVRDGGDVVPPIHPGCRCVLMGMTAAPRDERSGPFARDRP